MTQGKRRQQLLAVARQWQTSTDTQETFARRHGLSRSALQCTTSTTFAGRIESPFLLPEKGGVASRSLLPLWQTKGEQNGKTRQRGNPPRITAGDPSPVPGQHEG